jgi:hypothetical protein
MSKHDILGTLVGERHELRLSSRQSHRLLLNITSLDGIPTHEQLPVTVKAACEAVSTPISISVDREANLGRVEV